MKKARCLLPAFLVVLLLPGCAFDLVHIKQVPAAIILKTDPGADFTLAQGAELTLGTGYKRSLKAATNWTLVGSIPQGEVFRTRDQVLTVEGSNIYEAYLVLTANNLVGFYLPAERSYSPLNEPVALDITRH